MERILVYSMAFDGTAVAAFVKELQEAAAGGRITKISQPERDELLLTIKNYTQFKLYISASASLPLIYLTEQSKPAPMNAPNFCMLLRKHLGGAKVIAVRQPGLERIIQIELEHLDEMGDLCRKFLIVEMMGKHSNIIFCDPDFVIIDSIKRISGFVSSVREVLPGRKYFIPNTENKLNPLLLNDTTFQSVLSTKPMSVQKALYTSYTGISPILAAEACVRASIDPDMPAAGMTEQETAGLYEAFSRIMEDVKKGSFYPQFLYDKGSLFEFSVIPLTTYQNLDRYEAVPCPSVSAMLECYYASKNSMTRIRQKSQDLRRIVSTALERNVKKYDLQMKQLKDTQKRETYKLYGELLTTYGYQAEAGTPSITVPNYYDGSELCIPLDPLLSAIENAKHYFEKYNKQKRTYESLSVLSMETQKELLYLDSVRISLDIAVKEEDLAVLKEELIESGYIKRKASNQSGKGQNGKGQNGNGNGKGKAEKKRRPESMPFHYMSSEGYHIYVGKNNYQNDALTFQNAAGNDWWFHAKGVPGSHVLLKAKEGTPSDRAFEEAAGLAAHYSKSRENDKVEVDYLEKKHVKKPKQSKPGFVVYYTNFSMVVSPDISHLTLVDE